MEGSELLAILEPLAEQACASEDEVVAKVGVVLAALAGCLVPPVDGVALNSLVMNAGMICMHRLGQHAPT